MVFLSYNVGMSENYKIVNKTSEDIKKDRIDSLKKILPEAFEEGKVNLEKLKLVLGEDIDERPEKYNFTWAGKNNAIKTVLVPSKATLKPVKDESIKFDESDNLIIEGDNLEVLKLLQKTYFEKVKMIYIDPPYNTGGDPVYHDDFSAPINSYLKQTGQLDEEGNKQSTNKETNGRYHSDWLSMMYPRLKLAWNLLKDDGVIFISIDDNEVHNLRKIMDEIFGEDNFSCEFIWEKKKKPSFLHKNVGKLSEYILCYVKNMENTFPFSIDTTTKGKKYPFNNAGNSLSKLVFPINSVTFNISDQTVKAQDMSEGNIITKLINDVVIMNGKNANEMILEGEWRYSQSRLNEIIEADDKIVISKIPFRPNHIKIGGEIKKMKNILSPFHYGMETNEDATSQIIKIFGKDIFDNPKPIKLIKSLIKSCTYLDENSIILDFFAGSGTTAQATVELNQEDGGNRKFILVQLPEKTATDSEAYKAGYKTIAEITKERVRRVIKGYGENPKPVDSGFKAFKLTPSNYPEISFEFDPNKTDEENRTDFLKYLADAQQISLSDNNINPIDIVYENIIKEGFSFNSKVTEGKVDGNNLFIVSDGEKEMRICLDKKISPDSVSKLSSLEFKGKTFVCYDNSLSDSDKANIGLNLELKTI